MISRTGGRSGFTFFELILVLTVIVALAGLSWPQMSRFLRRESLMGNVEQVRQKLDRARVQAVEGGRMYQFRFEPHGRKYVLLPAEILLDSTEPPTDRLGRPTAASSSSRRGDSRSVTVQELAENCEFYFPPAFLGEKMTIEKLPEPFLALIQNGTSHRDVGWSPPILFSPDGSATNGSVTIADSDRRYVTLTVRGLTGAVTTSRLDKLPEQFDASAN